jgi:hypothetical protein
LWSFAIESILNDLDCLLRLELHSTKLCAWREGKMSLVLGADDAGNQPSFTVQQPEGTIREAFDDPIQDQRALIDEVLLLCLPTAHCSARSSIWGVVRRTRLPTYSARLRSTRSASLSWRSSREHRLRYSRRPSGAT